VPRRVRNRNLDPDASDLPRDEDVDSLDDATRVCPSCGARNYDDVELCHKCGLAFTAARAGPPPWAVGVVVLVIIGLLLAYIL